MVPQNVSFQQLHFFCNIYTILCIRIQIVEVMVQIEFN